MNEDRTVTYRPVFIDLKQNKDWGDFKVSLAEKSIEGFGNIVAVSKVFLNEKEVADNSVITSSLESDKVMALITIGVFL
jgi:hypothetical protein